MATKKNMAVIIATIKSIYPYYAKDTNIEVLAKTWLLLLQEYDDKIINNALILCMKECETPPTPAHIIKKIEEMQPKKTNTELWAELVDALNKIDGLLDGWQYLGTEKQKINRQKCKGIYTALPQELKDYVGSYSEMVRMAQSLDNKSLQIAKSQFLKLMPDIRKESEMRLITAKNIALLGENQNI